jgi:hypothetical protein
MSIADREVSMSTSRTDLGFPLAIIELFARVTSIASITLLVMLFQGEAFHPSNVALKEWIGLFFFPTGVIVGMVIAWWKEGLGALIALGSLGVFYLVYGFVMSNHIGGWAFVAFSSPALLFLAHWLLRHGRA